MTIVDHKNSINSITPRRIFGQECKKCVFYPESEKVLRKECNSCATGVMNITLRGNGLLQHCRLQPENGIDITQLSDEHLKKAIENKMTFFENCFSYSVEQEK